MYDQVLQLLLWNSFLSLFDIRLCFCVYVLWTGDLYLFCKGADSSIFPRVISGKVDQVRARVEHNAVVRTRRNSLTAPNTLMLSTVIISIVTTGCRSGEHGLLSLPFPVFCFSSDGSNVAFKQIHFLLHFARNLTKQYVILFFCHIAPAALVMILYNF